MDKIIAWTDHSRVPSTLAVYNKRAEKLLICQEVPHSSQWLLTYTMTPDLFTYLVVVALPHPQ